MDMSGTYMDFWTIHLYDFPSINGGQQMYRKGSNMEATLDMMEQYSYLSRITSYNVCYTKLLRADEDGSTPAPRKVWTASGFQTWKLDVAEWLSYSNTHGSAPVFADFSLLARSECMRNNFV